MRSQSAPPERLTTSFVKQVISKSTCDEFLHARPPEVVPSLEPLTFCMQQGQIGLRLGLNDLGELIGPRLGFTHNVVLETEELLVRRQPPLGLIKVSGVRILTGQEALGVQDLADRVLQIVIGHRLGRRHRTAYSWRPHPRPKPEGPSSRVLKN